MKYYKLFKEDGATEEVTKEEALRTLDGWFKKDFLDDVFNNEKVFRLYTPTSEVWVKTDEGEVPIAGLYGVCE